MATYKLKNDFINGVIPNTNGTPNILFKKGDEVEGVVYVRFIFNKNTQGIDAVPTVIPNASETEKVFIPLSELLITAKEQPSKTDGSDGIETRKTLTDIAAVIVGSVALYFGSMFYKKSKVKGIGLFVFGAFCILFGVLTLGGMARTHYGLFDRIFRGKRD